MMTLSLDVAAERSVGFFCAVAVAVAVAIANARSGHAWNTFNSLIGRVLAEQPFAAPSTKDCLAGLSCGSGRATDWQVDAHFDL